MTAEEIRERLEEIEIEKGELEIELSKIPDGCICDIDDWRDSRPLPVCDQFVEDDHTGYCVTCQHPEECHR